MTFRGVVLAIGVAWVAGVAIQSRLVAQQKTVWDGVYTEEQAKRGAELYSRDCASCHQDDLAGDGFAPGLAGPEFAAAWEGLSVGDLLERVRVSMPPSNPSSTTTAEKVDIITHILKSNRFPAGATELPKEPESLKQIEYRANKP
ncbi:MAG: cytochrome c [Acidobacteriota bacterium]|nr:cytochrome c [Acidobacteriota bacterium]